MLTQKYVATQNIINNFITKRPLKILLHCPCVTGIGSPEIAISTDLFAQGFAISPNLVNYKFQCILSQPDGSSSGIAELELKMNLPPTGGTCTFSPKKNSVMFNDWQLTCTDWYDPDGDGVSAYQLYGTLFLCFKFRAYYVFQT